ncbi:MAG TPA: ATP-binding protein, partial [Lachnospiraceae bacterium]|nr:ATP-binding protein [Lachnospiraceae bacterium]
KDGNIIDERSLLTDTFATLKGDSEQKQKFELAYHEAEAANKAKSIFLSNMSHDIRTPMNAIYGMAELLEEKDFGREEKEYIATIKRSSENLLSIINEILDFSKVDSGKMDVVEEPYEFNDMVQDVITIIEFRLKDKHIKLQLEIDANIPREMKGDETRIRQILINLLNNAVKFTNQGSITLNIKWMEKDDMQGDLMIDVIDTGIGISQENLSKLFTAFGQIDTRKNRNVEGTGLGLAICKKLIDIMGGDISVESKLKEGSTFRVVLPQKIYDPRPCNYVNKQEEIHFTKESYRITFTAPRAKVLIVDDNKVNRQVARELMKLFGFEASLAESGHEAVDRVQKHLVSYDIIFMDHMMPYMDGVEATKVIRKLNGDYAKTVPIVALTANAIKGVEQQFLDAGMNDYLPKPIRVEQLSDILRRWLPHKKQFTVGTSLEEIERKEANIRWDRLPIEELLDQLDGIDVESGIKNCAGSKSAYFELLQTYASSNLANVLNDYFEKEDLENYAITAHSIKGASKTIGALDVADKAYTLERAGKRGDITFIWDHHSEMVEEYTTILKMLKRIFFGNIPSL